MRAFSFLAIFFALAFASIAQAQNRQDILRKLRIVQENYNLNISQVNKLIQQQILASQTVRIQQKKDKVSSQNLEFMIGQLTSLRTKLDEFKHRLYIIDRLIFQVDSKYSGQTLKTFIEQNLLEMAYTEFLNNESIWRFMIYLSVAVRELYNPHEDIVGFIEGYINFSTISHPRSPFEYLHEGNYTNGSQVSSGSPIPQEELGEAWEKHVEKLTGTNQFSENLPVIQERIQLDQVTKQEKPIKIESIFDESTYPVERMGSPTLHESEFDLNR